VLADRYSLYFLYWYMDSIKVPKLTQKRNAASYKVNRLLLLGLLALLVQSTNTDAERAAGSRHPRVASPPQKTPIHHQQQVFTIRIKNSERSGENTENVVIYCY
jgi:hypothetical protein